MMMICYAFMTVSNILIMCWNLHYFTDSYEWTSSTWTFFTCAVY